MLKWNDFFDLVQSPSSPAQYSWKQLVAAREPSLKAKFLLKKDGHKRGEGRLDLTAKHLREDKTGDQVLSQSSLG
jgi:hypothetical protein